jgi:hypothetical protein
MRGRPSGFFGIRSRGCRTYKTPSWVWAPAAVKNSAASGFVVQSSSRVGIP